MNGDDVRMWVFLFVVFFLFAGEPNVWDKLHDKTMSMENCK